LKLRNWAVRGWITFFILKYGKATQELKLGDHHGAAGEGVPHVRLK
jgi:hypothetical protein